MNEGRLSLDHFAGWLRDLGSSEQTTRHRRAVAAAFVSDFPDFLDADDAAVEGWLDSQRLSPASRSTYLTHLRSLFRWAAQEGLTAGATLAPRGGPGTARSSTAYGTGRVMFAVPSGWRDPIEQWTHFMLAASRPPTTVYLREYHLRRLAAELPGVPSPYRVMTNDLTEWIARKSWSPETVRSYRSSLRSFYGWAHDMGMMTNNPAGLLPSVRRPQRVARPTPEAVLCESLARADSRVRLMVLLGARLGLRRAEIAQLHTRDVIPSEAGTWQLRVYGKGRKERVLPLVGELRDELAAFPEGWIFPGRDHGHLSPARVGELLSDVLGPGYTGHTLRHRFASTAYAGTHDLFAVQSLLGHSQPETTRQYVQVADDALTAAVEAAGGLR